MEKHFKLSNLPKGATNKSVIRTDHMLCRNCKVEFKNYWSLMNHRRDNHPSDKSCRYDLEDRCKLTAEDCWYKHKNYRNPNISNNPQVSFECFDCNIKSPAIKKFMPLVAIIEAHDALKNFWIW